MAKRHRLVARPPEMVWSILADGSQYGEWVVGTSAARSLVGNWPEKDSTIEYRVALGPVRWHGQTIVRRSEPPWTLELEADSGRPGTARIAIDVRTWGEHALITLDEHPLRGPGARLHNTLVDTALQLRHRTMLGRLARLIEDSTPEVRHG